MTPIPREFFLRSTILVAQELLGKTLVRRVGRSVISGRIVETEAYLPRDDPACHAAKGKNRKNASMFGNGGTAYVYVIHARFCFNIVTEEVDIPAAVLIRALEPLCGIPSMQQRRQRTNLTELARGPAMLCEALAIDRRFDGRDLTLGQGLFVAEEEKSSLQPAAIQTSPRIGVTSGHELPLRFYLRGNEFVSKISRTAIAAERAGKDG
jgi:DNA-3-methyladenine glycosylase